MKKVFSSCLLFFLLKAYLAFNVTQRNKINKKTLSKTFLNKEILDFYKERKSWQEKTIANKSQKRLMKTKSKEKLFARK